MWCRVTTCCWFFHHKPYRAVISSQKWSIQQKTSRSFICRQLLVLFLIPALTTWILRVNGEQRLRQIGCRSIQGQTRVLPVVPAPEERELVKWSRKREGWWEDMRDRQHEGKVGVVIDRLWLRWARQDWCQSVWSLSQLMRIFNISWVLCAL